MLVGLWIYAERVRQNYHHERNRTQQWRDVIDHASAAIIVVNSEGTIVQWSNGAQRLLGWTQHEAEGARLQLIIPPDRYSAHEAGFYNAKQRKKLLDGDVLQVNGYVMHKSGRVQRAQVSISAVCNGDSLFVAQVVRAEDVVDLAPTLPPSQTQYDPPDVGKFHTADR
jgi:PAS domain S-box-containing protein